MAETVAVCSDGDGGWMEDPVPDNNTTHVPKELWDAYLDAEAAWQEAASKIGEIRG